MNYQLTKNIEWNEDEVNGKLSKIPLIWEKELLGNDIIINKKNINKNITEMNYIDISCVNNNKIQYTTYLETDFPSRAKRIISQGDTIVSTVRPNLKCFVYIDKEHEDYVCSTGFVVLTPKNIDSKFLYYQFKNNKTTEFLIQGSTGATYPSFNSGLIEDFEYLKPSIEEQKNISKILSKQDSIISNIEQLIEKNEILFNEFVEKILSGEFRLTETDKKISVYKNPETNWKEIEINGVLKKMPSDWQINRIRNTIQLNMGSTPKKEDDNYIGDLPWITISNLNNKYISEYTAKIKRTKNIRVFPEGTLLISFKMSVGRSGFTTKESAINEAIMGIQQSGTNNVLNYLYYCLPNYFINNADKNGQGLLLLNQEKIKDLDYFTPAIKEQMLISTFLDARGKTIIKLKELLSKEKLKFEWLLDNLLSGNYLVKEV